MCLIAFAYKQHPRYPLIVIANRDEFYDRPTEQAAWWEEAPDLLAGRDVLAGGSWMGVGRNGRFAALTNFRDPHNIKPHAPTRGLLVTEYILGEQTPADYLAPIHQNGSIYNGFNLLVGGPDELWWYSNYAEKPQILAPGLYGLSNALLDSPWPKLTRVKEKLSRLLQSDHFDHEAALATLIDKDTAPDAALPDTGVPLEWERKLSAMYIEMERYGTRCSTVLSFAQSGEVRFTEHSYVPARGRVDASFFATRSATPSPD